MVSLAQSLASAKYQKRYRESVKECLRIVGCSNVFELEERLKQVFGSDTKW